VQHLRWLGALADANQPYARAGRSAARPVRLPTAQSAADLGRWASTGWPGAFVSAQRCASNGWLRGPGAGSGSGANWAVRVGPCCKGRSRWSASPPTADQAPQHGAQARRLISAAPAGPRSGGPIGRHTQLASPPLRQAAPQAHRPCGRCAPHETQQGLQGPRTIAQAVRGDHPSCRRRGQIQAGCDWARAAAPAAGSRRSGLARWRERPFADWPHRALLEADRIRGARGSRALGRRRHRDRTSSSVSSGSGNRPAVSGRECADPQRKWAARRPQWASVGLSKAKRSVGVIGPTPLRLAFLAVAQGRMPASRQIHRAAAAGRSPQLARQEHAKIPRRPLSWPEKALRVRTRAEVRNVRFLLRRIGSGCENPSASLSQRAPSIGANCGLAGGRDGLATGGSLGIQAIRPCC